MIDGIMRLLHLPWWVPFVVWFSLYMIVASGWIINGYAQEYLGWRHPGQPGKIHKVLVRFHTGAHIHPDRSYGDEKRLRKTAGSTNRATPEGSMVYWNPHGRPFRAVRNNLIIFLILVFLSLFVDDPKSVVITVTLLFLFGIPALVILRVLKIRKRMAAKRPVSRPALAVTKPARLVLKADVTTDGARPKLIEEVKPQLEGVPRTVLATLLAGDMVCSADEIVNRLTLNPDGGELILPDTYAARIKQREGIEELIRAHTDGDVRFTWSTTTTPRRLNWVPIIIQKLPDLVRFRDYLDDLQKLGPREFGIGCVANRNLFALSHNGDNPFWCRFAGSGTGKSTAFLVKAAQICHNDPKAEVYCIDTKQVSFQYLRDIPRVYIYDNPVSEMEKIYKVFYVLAGIMRDRYAAVREKRKTWDDFSDIWILCDEGNDLGACLKNYWKHILEEATATPAVWGECVGPLIRQGREARIFGEWMFQDLRDQAMGGESLKFGFNVFGAAGFLPGQFTRTVGNPAEECLEGPGKILMCRGNKRDWVQGFMDDPDWLHEYALENRKGIAA